MKAGLYIHIPFCEKRCGYCDFYTLAHGEYQIPAYLSALEKEIQLYSENPALKSLRFETIYFGGGTPSLLETEQIYILIQCLFKTLTFSPDPEITIETNPDTVSMEKLRSFRQIGINRISLGIQSFEPDELKFLDRIHSVEEAVTCFNDARNAGFDNISIDLLFALPYQKLQTWKKNLEHAAALEPEHISAYNLTFEDGTPLTQQLLKGKINMCSEESQRKMYLTTIDFLDSKGYQQYEISNYTKPGYESQHNQKYWNGTPYLGLGPSAHSLIENWRFWNVSNLNKYIESLSENKFPLEGEEFIGFNEASFEKVFLGLRQRRGIHLKTFESEMGISLFEKYIKPLSLFLSCNLGDRELISELTNGSRNFKSQLLKIEDGFLRLTKQGLLLCDTICAEFT